MPDFASAAMLRLTMLGLRRQGIEVPPLAVRTALVPLRDKRTLLDALWRRHGPDVLLRIGEAVHDIGDEPALLALALARDPIDLLQRWQRLERFVHSRHRIGVTATCERSFGLRHVSLKAGEPPTQPEDLLVFGLLVALVERIGTKQLRARVQGDRNWRRSRRQWHAQAWPADVSGWDFEWEPTRLQAVNASTPNLPDDLLQAASLRLAEDLGRDWSVHSLAIDLRTSKRTLQRRLGAAGSSFSQLLAAARAAQAARLLTTSAIAPAEIGYLCGFSDQAHFTREFKRCTAMTPVVYRQQFVADEAR